jgi:hypothetical protein
VGPGPVWTGAKNFVPTGIRSPDRPARSQSHIYIYTRVFVVFDGVYLLTEVF